MKKPDYIVYILILSILYILGIEFIKKLRDNVFYSTIIFLLVLLIMLLIKKKRDDLMVLSSVTAFFVLTRLLFWSIDQKILILRATSTLAFILINLVLLIGPLSRFSDKVLKLYYYRRHLGVITFFIAWLHPAIILPEYFKLSINSALSLPFIFYGFTAFMIMMWMGLTSWDIVQKKFKPMWWNILHSLLLLSFLLFSYNFYIIQKASESVGLHLMIIGIFTLFWILVAPYSIIKKILKTKVLGWKQLHVLVYIAYASIVLHVIFGPINTFPDYAKILFWTIIAFTISVHIAGWIKKLIEDGKINNKLKDISKTIREGNDTYIGAAYKEDIQEGAGKKVYIKNKPVALFKHKGNFIAMSDICAHQKGPLHKGKIVYDFVECPWHHWQYSVKDGKSPSGFKDCVPYYKTKVKDNIIYVSID